MKFALGWACNLNDIFVRFPYEKYKTLSKNYRTAVERLALIKRIFTAALQLILDDIIDNNVQFKIQGIGYQQGEIHFERISGDEFIKQRKAGKFKNIDFLESVFTGYQLCLYIKGKRDTVFAKKKIPIYFSKKYRDKLAKNVNSGKQYC